MNNLEELECRKKELELKRDIAKLERNERIASKVSSVMADAKDFSAEVSDKVVKHGVGTSGWSWLLVGPLTLFGLYLVLGGLIDGPKVIALIGLSFLIPAWAKLKRK